MKTLIIGKGNVGTHLFKALEGKTDITLIDSRKMEDFPDGNFLAVLCVKDDYIESTAKALKGKAFALAHTSGSVTMEVLKPYADHYGVIYPLQTFSKKMEMNYHEIPFFIEANDMTTENMLSSLASLISNSVTLCDSQKRKYLHLASVFACNFSNHLMQIAKELLDDVNIDYKVLLPLLSQSIKKLHLLEPVEAQTGPAARQDLKILETHREMLEDQPELLSLYDLFSNRIMKKL